MKAISRHKHFWSCAALFAGVAALGVPLAAAQSGELSMLSNLTKGEWTIKHRDGSPDVKICVRSGLELIQLRHSQSNCNRFVVSDGPNKVSVQYSCRGNGYGRTDIRRETNSLVQINTKGIADGDNFDFTAEARRSGTC